MSNNDESQDFEKMFEQIISSEELKNIKEEYESNVKFGVKELILIQQSLADVNSHICEIILRALSDGDLLFGEDNVYHNLLSSLYKISEDFNECMLDFYADYEDEEEDYEDE